MGKEQVESLERGLAGGGIDVPGTEPGEVGPAEPESGPEADDGQSWLGDSAAQRLTDSGSESNLEAGLDDELTEPGEAGPAEPATDAPSASPGELAGDFGGLTGDVGQAAGTVERGVAGDLSQVSGDVASAAGTAGSAERVVAGDAGRAMHDVGTATGDMAERAGQVAESLLPAGGARGDGPQPGESSRPRVEPGLAHDDTEPRPAPAGADSPGLRLESPQVPEPAPRSQPR
jgi:hypothetical protein